MKELPAWPQAIEYEQNERGDITLTHGHSTHDVVAYERARAEAAIARLKVAVEALKEVEFESMSADMGNDCADETHMIAIDAISAIGDIPE